MAAASWDEPGRGWESFSTRDPSGSATLPPPDRLVDTDSHEDDGEEQSTEDAAQQHCRRRQGFRLEMERITQRFGGDLKPLPWGEAT